MWISGRSKSTIEVGAEVNMADDNKSIEPTPGATPPDDIVPKGKGKGEDESLLKQILSNQKKTDKMIEKRFKTLDSIVQDSKSAFDNYSAKNNKAMDEVRDNVSTAMKEIKALQSDVLTLKQDLTKAKQDLYKTRNKLDLAPKDLQEKNNFKQT